MVQLKWAAAVDGKDAGNILHGLRLGCDAGSQPKRGANCIEQGVQQMECKLEGGKGKDKPATN